jgi:hypothetical protein
MRYFLLLLFLIGHQWLYSQQLITDDSIILKKGFYRHFTEFKYNKPSLPFNYTIDTCSTGYGKSKIYATGVYYTIKQNDDKGKIPKDVFGFCDGRYIYISIGKAPLSTTFVFVRLILKGRYSLFGLTNDNGRIPVPLQEDGIAAVSKSDQLILIDMNNGMRLLLKPRTVKNILKKNDKELFNRYKSEKNSKIKLVYYLTEYSLKHKSEIKKSKLDATSGEIIGTLEKLPGDSTFEFYYHRVIKDLKNFSDITNVELWQSKYRNGNYKFIGLKAIHKLSSNDTYNYKIGYWRYFYSNGDIKKEVIYDLTENEILEREFELKNKD